MCPQTSAQQALTGTINSSMHAVQAAQASLDDFDTLPPLGTDAVRLNSLEWFECRCDMSTKPSVLDLCHQRFFFSLFKASQAWRKNKMDESKHEIHSQVDAITAGTASMVNLTAGKNTVLHLVASNMSTFSPCCSDVENTPGCVGTWCHHGWVQQTGKSLFNDLRTVHLMTHIMYEILKKH